MLRFNLPHREIRRLGMIAPAMIIFISANIANVANMGFNMIFARVMNPAEFADLTLLLTLKLSLLSCLSALQFSISDFAARDKRLRITDTLAGNITRTSLKYSVFCAALIIIFADFIAQSLNFNHANSLRLLAVMTPFFIPLVIYRGLAQGRTHLSKMVLSTQTEWIIRLVGCWGMWTAGFGLSGIAVALTASILVGLIFTTSRSDFTRYREAKTQITHQSEQTPRTLLKTSLPYGALFLAQALVLDSDIVVAKLMFDPETAGLSAGLLLIQRVFFFAFISLSMVLQPVVIQKTRHGKNAYADMTVLLCLVFTVSALSISILILFPDLFVTLLLGSQYSALAPLMGYAAGVGACFIITHMTAVFFISSGDPRAALGILALALFQITTLALAARYTADFTPETYIGIKLAIHAFAATLAILVLWIKSLKNRERHAVISA